MASKTFTPDRVRKRRVPKTRGKLQYPASMDLGKNDHMLFYHAEWTKNGTGGKKGRLPQQGNLIRLYMPNSTPSATNSNMWEDMKFEGALGLFTKNALTAAGKADAGPLFDPNGMRPTGEALRQLTLGIAAGKVGADAGTALVLGKGSAYNPNIEMIYRQPQLRQFQFTFMCAPANEDDSKAIDDIIMEFKKFSAPELLESMNFMKVPDIWQIKYCVAGGADNTRMNFFKPAALTGVTVHDNPAQDMHMSYHDGTPAVTAIGLKFTEVDIITRETHEKDGARRGF